MEKRITKLVTILVLVEYSLQCKVDDALAKLRGCHNPCFSRILFAIRLKEIREEQIQSHNPCFSRILFAINIT